MAGFDTFIRAGGAGIDIAKIQQNANIVQNQQKRNQLMDIGIANAPAVEARAAAQETRLQSQENRNKAKWETIEQLRQGSRLLNYLDNETPDIKGAMAYISEDGITEKEKPTLALLQGALESGDLSQVGELRNTLIGLKKTALEMGDIEQSAQQETFSNVAQEDLPPGVSSAQVSDLTSKRVNERATPSAGEGQSALTEKINLAAEVIFRRRSDPDDSAYTQGFTQQNAMDEATERELLDKGIKVLQSGRGFGVDPLATTENVTDLPIKSSLAEVPPPLTTAMEVSDNVAGPIAVTARTGEKFLSMLGLQKTTELSEQRRFVLGLLPDLIRSRSTNPGKTSLVERKLILEQLGIEPGFFTGASEFEGNIRALDRLLDFSEKADTALLASTGISSDLRDRTTRRLIITKNTRAQLGNAAQKTKIVDGKTYVEKDDGWYEE